MPTGHVPSGSRTVGIDLASQPRDTGVCVIDWSTSPATVVPQLGVPSDELLLELMVDPTVSKVAIDAPFGWPLAFIDVITTFRDRSQWLDLEPNDFRFRATDMQVAELTGQTPLSVAMSDLAWPAMRCARLLAAVSGEAAPLDRGGAGRFAEVYPAAALRRWEVIEPGASVTAASYKRGKPGRRDRRELMVGRLEQQLGGVLALDSDVRESYIDSDDELDAFVSALTARALELRLTDPIPKSLRWAAVREGWIHLPAANSLPKLAG